MSENARYAEVIPLLRLPRSRTAFDYRIPEPLRATLRIGMIVTIPFRKRPVAGVIFKLKTNSDVSSTRIAEIIRIDDPEPIVTAPFLETLCAIAKNLCLAPGLFLRGALPEVPRHLRRLDPRLIPTGDRASTPTDTFITIPHRDLLKTYLANTITESIAHKKTLLILFPLREQAENFARYFTENKIPVSYAPADLGKIAQYALGKQFERGEIPVLMGTRSALFFEPPHGSTYILVDETAPEWKQEDINPRYDARLILPLIARATNSSVIRLGTLPTLNTYHKLQITNYELPVTSYQLRVTILNLKNHWRSGNRTSITDELLSALKESSRALLFVARVGRATTLRCHDCYYLWRCATCDVALAAHRTNLRCPTCRALSPMPLDCPTCHSAHFISHGVGVERVEDELRDALGDAMRNVEIGSVGLINNLKSNVATPPFDLVAIVDADSMLFRPDFKSTEKLSSLLADCASFANNEYTRFIIQTSFTELPVWNVTRDQSAFFDAELEDRKTLHYPPFYRMAKLIFQDKNPTIVEKQAHTVFTKLRETLKDNPTIEISTPYRAAPFVVRGRARMYIVLRFRHDAISHIEPTLATLPDDIIIDLDPASLL